jgi:hypothetical protein
MTKGPKAVLLLAAAALSAPSGRCLAVGLSTTMGRVFVGNVPVGSTMSLRDLSGVTYKITNTSLNAEDVEIAVLKPEPAEGILLPGYEPLPDSGWAWLSQNRFHLAPGQQAAADVLVHIPKDPKHLAKKYQFSLWARNVTQGRFLAVGLKSRIMLEISHTLASAQEMKKAGELLESLDFHFSPPDLNLAQVPCGGRINVREAFKKGFKLINLSDKPMRVKLKAQSRVLSGLGSMADAIDDAAEIYPEKPEMTIEANSIGLVNFSVRMPEGERFEGRKVRMVLQAELQDYGVPVSAYGQVVATVGCKGGKPK